MGLISVRCEVYTQHWEQSDEGWVTLAGEVQEGFMEKLVSVITCDGWIGCRHRELQREIWEKRECAEVKLWGMEREPWVNLMWVNFEIKEKSRGPKFQRKGKKKGMGRNLGLKECGEGSPVGCGLETQTLRHEILRCYLQILMI